jgi:hypothetical protein
MNRIGAVHGRLFTALGPERHGGETDATLNRHLVVLAAALCLMAGLSCAGIAAPTHEETLTAWAEQKGWSQFSAYPWLGYRSDEYGSYDISIVHDRPEEWMKRPPYNREERGDYSYYAEIREPITVAGGLAAWREYHKQTLFEAPNSKPGDAKEHENWEYYCHEYLVVVRAQRNTADNSKGSDPIGILEEYIAFARGNVSEPVPTASEEPEPPAPECRVVIVEIEGEEAIVDVRGDGDLDFPEVGMVLTKNAKIITGLGARVRAEFKDCGIRPDVVTFTVEEMSIFSIRELLTSRQGMTAATNMKVGEVNVKVDRKYKDIDFSVSLPTCTASVRGTEFTISHREDPVETRISVISGEVEVTPKLFSAPSVTLVAGDEIAVYEDRFGEITRLADDPSDPFAQACASLCASDEDFIRSLYHCITHREPTAEELEAQVGRLQSGTLRRDMVQYFFASPGYVDQNHTGVRFITDACQAIYGRDPSDAELSAWPRTDRSFIVIDMLDSPEHLAATQACAGLWRRDAVSVPTLPYADDLSSGLAHWDVSKVTLQEADGALLWQSGNHLPVSWRYPIPMEDVVIEFDGWCEKNGLGVMWINEESVGYFATLGGWFNTRSCSDGRIRGFGLPAEQREYVDGAHIRLGEWQHYRLVRSGDWLDFYVDGTRIIHREILHRYEGQGTLTFASYGSVVGIDNLRVYRATAEEGSAAEGVL